MDRKKQALRRPDTRTSVPKFHRSALAALLFSTLVAFGALYGPWIRNAAMSPALPTAHWVSPRQAGVEPHCFDLDVEQPDIYGRQAGIDPDVQTTKYCEDLELLHGEGLDGWSMLSCDPNRAGWNTVLGPIRNPRPRGALWMFNYAAAARVYANGTAIDRPALLRLDGFPKEKDFHPIGADVVPAAQRNARGDASGPHRLFVINHAGKWSTIEVFDLHAASTASGWYAKYVQTIDHPSAAHQPNALVALGPNELLVTQDHLFPLRARPFSQLREIYTLVYGEPAASVLASIASIRSLSKLLMRAETILGLPTGFVTRVHLEEHTGKVTVSLFDRGIAFANGISRSPNGKVIAVASTTMPGVLLYRRRENEAGKAHDSDWVRSDKIFTPNRADNIAFSRSNDQAGAADVFGSGSKLVVTGAISGIKMLKFARDPTNMSKASPSWVAAISPKRADTPDTDDPAPLPSQKMLLRSHADYSVKTLYQGHKPTRLAEPYLGYKFVGIASAAGASLDETVGGGSLLVAGIFSDPGVMVCYGVGL
ncbi:hypothetical protein EX895_005155 [Sporisorium graminicola]|uniref:Calcium-dependent phosphotriesterase n=1 Tax=Sporisorium graminicola TaxID=280036 RepID=A0A4U7KPP7_9BASI|nr:hypothetical protein EX895_005155 [Sporisorium graminicola]TKY86330.1 hypothetical protein EX895_005155 [Sporisorium graminicola]